MRREVIYKANIKKDNGNFYNLNLQFRTAQNRYKKPSTEKATSLHNIGDAIDIFRNKVNDKS